MEKEVIILTCSDKNNGYCVAGIDLSTGKFIRLVSEDSDTDYALTYDDILYEDLTIIAPMDIINVILKRVQNSINQPENYVINNHYYFAKIGQASRNQIRKYLMKQDYIFYNTEKSVTQEEINRVLNKYSLILVKVDELDLWPDNYNQSRLTASFSYMGNEYRFIKITDSKLTEKYRDRVVFCSPRPYRIYRPMIIMSLTGRPYKDGKYYKLIANIIEDDIADMVGGF